MIKGSVQISFEALNLERLLNKIADNGIKIYDISKQDRRIVLTVRHSDKKQLLKLLDGCCSKLQIISERGAAVMLAQLKKRLALIISVAAAVCLIAAFNSFVWNIKIVGTETIAPQQIVSTLKENGISVGQSKKIDVKECQMLILRTHSQVSYATVQIKGVTLIIDIVETIPKNQPIDTTPASIYSTVNGVVTKIVVIAGTPQVKVGDKITVGQLLISGTVTYGDSTVKQVKALGDVYADVTVSSTAEHNLMQDKLVRSGEYYDLRQLKCVFGVFDIKDKPKDYEFFEQVELEQSYTFLPFKICITRVYRLIKVTNSDDTQIEEFLKLDALKAATELLPPTVKADNIGYTVEKTQLKITVTAHVTYNIRAIP